MKTAREYYIRALLILLLLFFFSIKPVLATQPHYTLLINQVRGQECCDPGNLKYLQNQLDTITRLGLKATFAVRYDALLDNNYVLTLQNTDNDLAGLLEITPSLASNSGVVYHGTPEKWYEASNVYLVGYSQEDRKKLIDTYMDQFAKTFGYTPKVTVAWMIDAFSLHYLYDQYGILAHEITREQWNVDSITLYGGPPHYPYLPSKNWAIIPTQSENQEMPLIIRQTIADPADNYGDNTNSHTSQANDYMQQKKDINYFQFVFNQAHNQPLNPYTFAVVGLENSMPDVNQSEFDKQLEYISSWQKENLNNKVVTVKDFIDQKTEAPMVYAGNSAWWITTPYYRARVRLDNQKFYLSDIRIYDEKFIDPYYETSATGNAYWVVPFLLDGSRFLVDETSYDPVINPSPDNITGRKSSLKDPTHILIREKIGDIQVQSQDQNIIFMDENGTKLLTFSKNYFELPKNAIFNTDNPFFRWTIIFEEKDDFLRFNPIINTNNIDIYRQENSNLLLPKLASNSASLKTSILHVNNRYAILGRNPIRLVYFPRNDQGYPVAVSDELEVTTQPEVTKINISTPDRISGAIFIDLFNESPLETKVTVGTADQKYDQILYFSPNCKENLLQCISNPKYLWWYLNNFSWR